MEGKNGRAMKILLVSEHWPWPEFSGARQRMAVTVEALAAVAEIDLLHIDRGWQTPLPLDDPPPSVSRHRRVALHDASPLTGAARRLRRPWQPADLALLDNRLVAECRDFIAGAPPDLVWCNKEVSYAPIRRAIPRDTPVVIDIDDLYEMTANRWQARQGRAGLVRRLELAHSTWAWRRAHRRHARRAERVLLCSEIDVTRTGVPNAVVVPNSHRTSVREPRGPAAGVPPTLLFQGLFTYPPNEDAARTLAVEILPRVRATVPDARLLLVGHHGGRLDDLARIDGVRLTGQVPAMEPWLERAHVAAVAVRAGSGTRTKILEAVAYGIPVVSTTIGIEGLDFRAGAEAVVSDDWEEFAAQCARLMTDSAAAEEMAIRAQRTLGTRYSPDIMRRSMLEVARQSLHPAESLVA